MNWRVWSAEIHDTLDKDQKQNPVRIYPAGLFVDVNKMVGYATYAASFGRSSPALAASYSVFRKLVSMAMSSRASGL